MATQQVVKEFVEKVLAFEAEKKELSEAEKMLYADYKEKLDVKAFKAAMRIAKIRSRLDTDEETEVDTMLNVMVDKV